MKIIIFGAGGFGKEIYDKIKDKYDVISFFDNNPQVTTIEKIPVVKPNIDDINKVDKIILGTCYPSIKTQLLSIGVNEVKIDDTYVNMRILPRINFLKNFALMNQNKIGCVAEAGVFQGEFAKYINEYFPNKILYLFDTFTGFDENDTKIEIENHYSNSKTGLYSDTTKDLVLSKMKYRHNCIIKEGLFPDSSKDVNSVFLFVNLDMDLYKPTIEGLNFFNNKMVKDGLILIHDYFSHYTGVKHAVDEFLSNNKNLYSFPIGDELSIAIIGW